METKLKGLLDPHPDAAFFLMATIMFVNMPFVMIPLPLVMVMAAIMRMFMAGFDRYMGMGRPNPDTRPTP